MSFKETNKIFKQNDAELKLPSKAQTTSESLDHSSSKNNSLALPPKNESSRLSDGQKLSYLKYQEAKRQEDLGTLGRLGESLSSGFHNIWCRASEISSLCAASVVTAANHPKATLKYIIAACRGKDVEGDVDVQALRKEQIEYISKISAKYETSSKNGSVLREILAVNSAESFSLPGNLWFGVKLGANIALSCPIDALTVPIYSPLSWMGEEIAARKYRDSEGKKVCYSKYLIEGRDSEQVQNILLNFSILEFSIASVVTVLTAGRAGTTAVTNTGKAAVFLSKIQVFKPYTNWLLTNQHKVGRLLNSYTMSGLNAGGNYLMQDSDKRDVRQTATAFFAGTAHSAAFGMWLRTLGGGLKAVGVNQQTIEKFTSRTDKFDAGNDGLELVDDSRNEYIKFKNTGLELNQETFAQILLPKLIGAGMRGYSTYLDSFNDSPVTINSNVNILENDIRCVSRDKKIEIKPKAPSPTAELEESFSKLEKLGEDSKGEITAEIMAQAYDVLIKTAEYWQKNNVNFLIGIRHPLDKGLVLYQDGESNIEFLKVLQNASNMDFEHFPELIINYQNFSETPKAGTLGFLARKIFRKPGENQGKTWFLAFSPLRIKPFLKADAFFDYQTGITLGKSEVLKLGKGDNFSHEYIHAFFEGIQSPSRAVYIGLSPLFDAMTIITTKDNDRKQIHLEEIVTYFADATREFADYGKTPSFDLNKSKIELISARDHSMIFKDRIQVALQKLETRKTSDIEIMFYQDNAISFTFNKNKENTTHFMISPLALCEEISELRPTRLQTVLHNFASFLNSRVGTKFQLPQVFNFNSRYREKALAVCKTKLQYSSDFIAAYDKAIENLIVITDYLQTQKDIARPLKSSITSDLQKSIGLIKDAIASYIFWSVPNTYQADNKIEEIKTNLPTYKYFLTAERMLEIENVLTDKETKVEDKVSCLYQALENCLVFGGMETATALRESFINFLDSLPTDVKRNLLLSFQGRNILKKFKIKM